MSTRRSTRERKQTIRYAEEEEQDRASSQDQAQDDQSPQEEEKPQQEFDEQDELSSDSMRARIRTRMKSRKVLADESEESSSGGGSAVDDEYEKPLISYGFAETIEADFKQSDDAKDGHISDGVDYDEIEDLLEQEKEKTLKQPQSQQQQTHRSQNEIHNKYRQAQELEQQQKQSDNTRIASLAGQKRVHKIIQKEKRPQYCEDDSFETEQSQDLDAQKDIDSDVDVYVAQQLQLNNKKQQKSAMNDDKYLQEITGGQFKIEKSNKFKKRRKTASTSHLMNVIQKSNNDEQDMAKEIDQNINDERIEGSFKSYEPRTVKRLIGFPKTQQKRKEDPVEVLCLMSWWPSLDDPQLIPFDSEVSYKDVREKAPELLVDYFEKRMQLV